MEDTRTGPPLRSGEIPDGDDLVSLPTGFALARYQLIETLGQGTFGITYRAHDQQLDRAVAVKEYLPAALAVRHGGTQVMPRSTRLAEDFRWGRDRFLAEAQTLARFENAPAVVRVYDFLEANGTAYMVMELLRGETLEARLRRDGRLSPAALESLLPPLLDGLERVHATGILHRDIKPSNITLDAEGRPTLLDFGAARAAIAGRTQAMTAVYTPGYAAVEQFTSTSQGPYTDIYGLSATLYQCVTGAMPPTALERLLDDRLVPASQAAVGRYPAQLLAGIDAGLAIKAQDRPPTVAAWRGIFEGRGPAASTPTRPPNLIAEGSATRISRHRPAPAQPRPVRARRWIIAAAIGLVVVGAAAAGGYLYIRDAELRAAAERAEAERRAAEAAEREAQRRAEEERARVEQARHQAEEEAKRRAEEEAKRQAQLESEAEAQRQEEARRQAEAEARRRQEDAQRQAAEDARRKAEAEARRQQEDDARRKAEADARQRQEEARRKAEADARQRQEEDARHRAAADEARRKAETDTRQRQEEERRRAADEARRKAEADARRQQQEAAARRPPGVDGTWNGTVECYPGGPKGAVSVQIASGQGQTTVQGMKIALRISDSSVVSDLAWIGGEGREWAASLRGRPTGDSLSVTGTARTLGGRQETFRPQCTLNLRRQ